MKAYWKFGLAAVLAAAPAVAQEAAISQAGPASAPPPTAKPAWDPMRPDWLRRPTQDQIARRYPSGAPKGLAAQVMLHCRVAASGRLEDCKVISETPEGLGFGKAALELSMMFQMRPDSQASFPATGREAFVPVEWKLPAP